MKRNALQILAFEHQRILGINVELQIALMRLLNGVSETFSRDTNAYQCLYCHRIGTSFVPVRHIDTCPVIVAQKLLKRLGDDRPFID